MPVLPALLPKSLKFWKIELSILINNILSDPDEQNLLSQSTFTDCYLNFANKNVQIKGGIQKEFQKKVRKEQVA